MLYEYNLTGFDHRHPPQTAVRVDQQLRTMTPMQAWWSGLLLMGSPQFGHQVGAKDLYDEYRGTHPRYPLSANIWASELLKLCPGITKQRASWPWARTR